MICVYKKSCFAYSNMQRQTSNEHILVTIDRLMINNDKQVGLALHLLRCELMSVSVRQRLSGGTAQTGGQACNFLTLIL